MINFQILKVSILIFAIVGLTNSLRCFECQNCALAFDFEHDLITQCPNAAPGYAVCRVRL